MPFADCRSFFAFHQPITHLQTSTNSPLAGRIISYEAPSSECSDHLARDDRRRDYCATIHAHYLNPLNRRMMTDYAHAAACYRSMLLPPTVDRAQRPAVYGVALTQTTSTARYWSRIVINRISIGAADATHEPCTTNDMGRINLALCRDWNANEDEEAEDEDTHGSNCADHDTDERYEQTADTGATDEFDVPGLDKMYVVHVRFIDVSLDLIALPLHAVSEIDAE